MNRRAAVADVGLARAKVLLGLAIGACLPAQASGAPPHSEGQLSVTIAAVAPMTGPTAVAGKDLINGALLAVEDLRRRDLRIGGRPVVWRFAAEDDQGDPKQAATIAQKLVDQHVNGVVGHLTSSCTYAASGIYERAGLAMITPGASDPQLASQGFKTFFRIFAGDDALAPGLVDYAAARMQVHRVALIDDRTAYGHGLAKHFAKAASQRGLQILTHEYTHDRATDFAAIVTKVRAVHPELVFFAGNYSQAGPLLRQMRRLDLRVPLLGGDFICVPQLAKLAATAADAASCGQGGVPLDQMPEGLEWKRRFDARFGPDAYQLYSPYAYDAVMVLAQAMVKADSADPKQYLSFIRDVGADGVTRKHIHFQANGNLADPQITISRFEHGQLKVTAVQGVN